MLLAVRGSQRKLTWRREAPAGGRFAALDGPRLAMAIRVKTGSTHSDGAVSPHRQCQSDVEVGADVIATHEMGLCAHGARAWGAKQTKLDSLGECGAFAVAQRKGPKPLFVRGLRAFGLATVS